jgi:hypothetical protein
MDSSPKKGIEKLYKKTMRDKHLPQRAKEGLEALNHTSLADAAAWRSGRI